MDESSNTNNLDDSPYSERLALIIKATGVGIWDWKVQTGELTFNDRWAEIIGYTVEELQPIHFETWAQSLHPDDLANATDVISKHFAGLSPTYEIELRMRHKQGHYVWVLASGKLVEKDASGNPIRMLGTHLDITERKNNEQQMLVTSQLLNESQKIAHLGGWELDLKTGKLFWTEETYRIHETTAAEFNPTVDAGVDYFLPESQTRIVNALDEAVNKGLGYDLELETYTTKGRKIDVRTTCIVTKDGDTPIRLTGIFQDISEQKAIQRKLEQSNQELELANSALKLSAHYDALTGLPNRTLLADRLQQAIAKSTRKRNLVAIAFIDLDGFKQINDSYGHSIGDELLKEVAIKIQHVLRDGDTLARIGGDEFVAILDDLTMHSECDLILSRILKSVSRAFLIDDKLLKISASAGVTIYPLDSANSDQLLRHADQAMYIAKQKGKNQYHIFDVENDVAVKQRTEELKRIAHALSNNEFKLYYQPKIDLRTKAVVGVEALVRWLHPDKGVLSPAMFLPFVENDLLMIQIDKWVTKNALQQFHVWKSIGVELPISINISPIQLQHEEFVSDLNALLLGFPAFKPGDIEFEILESSALKDVELVSKVILDCNKLGILFSIDDFGTGYSSLTYLKRLPAKYLKIDQSFIKDMLSDKDDMAIVQGIIELAKVFNLDVVSEGVETPEHGQALLELGAYIAQGYGIAKPMPADKLVAWLEDWQKNPMMVTCKD